MRCSEGPGCSLGSPALEVVESSRGGGEKSRWAEETEEDSDRPLQHAAGQRAAGRVSTMCTVHTYTRLSDCCQQILGVGPSTLGRIQNERGIFWEWLLTVRVCVSVCCSQEYLNREVYTNKPTKDYFHQFNTSSRWPPLSSHRLVPPCQHADKICRLLYSLKVNWISGDQYMMTHSDTHASFLLAATGDTKRTFFETDCSTCFIFQSYIQLQW